MQGFFLEDRLRLRAFSMAGEMTVDEVVGLSTISLSGKSDCDIPVAELGEASILVCVRRRNATALFQGSDGERQIDLPLDHPIEIGSITLLLSEIEVGEDLSTTGSSIAEAYSPLLAMVVELGRAASRPMSGHVSLRDFLGEMLRTVIRYTDAESGLLVVAEDGGFTPVASHGLDRKGVQRLWEKMPHRIAEEILRNGTRVLLPDALRSRMSSDTTLFVRGVKSVAGFPVVTEDQLQGILYLGFDNLVQSLSEEMQQALEAVADVLGLVMQRAGLREQLESLRLVASRRTDSLPSGRLMVGSSVKLAAVYRLITRLAPVDVPILIQGETGTGKELAAKELHRMSPRGDDPFVVVNAAALPESLIESELFGHKKGAFTGALSDRMGLVEQAHRGTLFIDEIGELPLSMQSKLLRVLQERAVTRVGDSEVRQVDFRMLAATHRDLRDMLTKGTFREDLYYRIAGAVIPMPSLRERPEDIIPLANFFRTQFAKRHDLADKEWSENAVEMLQQAPWAGNIRELENVVARAFVMAEGPVIRSKDLDFPSEQGLLLGVDAEVSLGEAKDAWMREYLARALMRHGGRRGETARALGIGERTLFRYIEQFGIRE